MNKIYTVGHKCSEHVNIVVASSSKEAKLIGMNYEWTEDVDYLDLRVKAVKGGNGFFNEYPEFEFHISGKGFIYTNLQPHSMDWEDFISELERQKRLVFETGLFECFHSYDDEYFGLTKVEIDEMQKHVDHDLSNFDDICEAYGIDVKKITYEQINKLFIDEFGLPDIKKHQMEENQCKNQS